MLRTVSDVRDAQIATEEDDEVEDVDPRRGVDSREN